MHVIWSYNFTIAHIPGKTNTAVDFLSRLATELFQKKFPTVRGEVQIKPNEVNFESTGIAKEDEVFFQTHDF